MSIKTVNIFPLSYLNHDLLTGSSKFGANFIVRLVRFGSDHECVTSSRSSWRTYGHDGPASGLHQGLSSRSHSTIRAPIRPHSPTYDINVAAIARDGEGQRGHKSRREDASGQDSTSGDIEAGERGGRGGGALNRAGGETRAATAHDLKISLIGGGGIIRD